MSEIKIHDNTEIGTQRLDTQKTVQPDSNMTASEARNFWDGVFKGDEKLPDPEGSMPTIKDPSAGVRDIPEGFDPKDNSDINPRDLPREGKLDDIDIPQIIDSRLPANGGEWSGEPGDSSWRPDRDVVPKNPLTNPEGKTWGEILDGNGIEEIPFKDGEPDFSDVSKGDVHIDDFTDNRSDNFDQADQKLAEQRGCSPEEVRDWRKENGYTWHECGDQGTMQKVPTEVHGNVPHSGGVSAYKNEHNGE